MRKTAAAVIAFIAAPLMASCASDLHPTIEDCDPSNRSMSFALKKACADQGLFARRHQMQEEELRGLNSRGKKLAEEEQRLRTDVRNTGSVKEDLRRMEQSLNRSTRKLRNSISAEDRNRADVQQKLREIDRLQNDAAAISPETSAETRKKQRKLEELQRKQSELESILMK
ncbi:MAG: hypothetical protein SPL69_12545 [Succinivibrionaceae bacterium]|jgi:chromosome segregation ATPase|nr:hypothetical protein [Succinivibrionaceae bacterium]MDY6376923.1 hypothetical protein [Succinivibrionaceae bacterium]